MKAASCFSGIGAPELGGPQFEWLWCAEVEKFPSAVLAARFPQSVNLGDVTADDFLQRASAFGPLDLLVGGPPCQDFSVAGLRAGTAGDRGNLSLRFMEIAHAIRPRNLLVENVPGWLNMPDNAFGCFLGALVGADDALRSPLDGKWPSAGMVAGPRARAAWRVFDAQYFGVAQRRRRVFVVADFGDGADPAAVLFERKSVSGNTPPRREAGARVAALTSTGVGTCGADDNQAQAGHLIHCHDVAPTLNTHLGDKQGLEDQHINGGCGHFIAHSLRGEGFDASEDGTGRGTPIVPVQCIHSDAIGRDGLAKSDSVDAAGVSRKRDAGLGVGDDVSFNLTTGAPHAIAFSSKDYGNDATDVLSPTLRSMGHDKSHANGGGQMAVAFQERGRTDGRNVEWQDDLSYSLNAPNGGGRRQELNIAAPVAFAQNQRDELRTMDIAGALAAEPGMKQTTYIQQEWQVRRLTPTECARLQGFPDDHCAITYRGKPAADGPMYKSFGNSWAVPNGAWILARLAKLLKAERLAA